MPSPMEATSRRMACESVTTCSVATVSGSARRIATCCIERAVMRISCERRARLAVAKKNATGPKAPRPNSAAWVTGSGH